MSGPHGFKAAIIALGGLAVAGSASAQTRAPAPKPADLQQLIRLMEEQQREIGALRSEIDELKKARAGVVVAVPAPATRAPGAPDAAAMPPGDPMSADAAPSPAPAPGQAKPAATAGAPAPGTPLYVTAGEYPGSFKLPGTDLSFRISGFGKGDFIQSFGRGISTTGEDFLPPAVIPTRPTSDRTGDLTKAHGRQSRLAFDAWHPTPWGPAHAQVEGDFFGPDTPTETLSNSYEFRLRHAYIELDKLLIGQFWGTFTDPSAYPETLDFAGPNAQAFIRQGQVRWTQPIDSHLSVAVAVENPEGQVFGGTPNFLPTSLAPTESVPDGVIRMRYQDSWGHLQSGVVLRQLQTGRGATAGGLPLGNQDSTFGYGLNISGRIAMPWLHEKDNLRFQFQYGEGIGRYIQDIGFVGFDSFVNAAGRIEALEAYGGYLSYQHWWTNTVRSSLIGSYVSLDQAGVTTASLAQYQTGVYSAMNLIWSPIPRVDIGIEVLYGRREDHDGLSGDLIRFQSSGIFRF